MQYKFNCISVFEYTDTTKDIYHSMGYCLSYWSQTVSYSCLTDYHSMQKCTNHNVTHQRWVSTCLIRALWFCFLLSYLFVCFFIWLESCNIDIECILTALQMEHMQYLCVSNKEKNIEVIKNTQYIHSSVYSEWFKSVTLALEILNAIQVHIGRKGAGIMNEVSRDIVLHS